MSKMVFAKRGSKHGTSNPSTWDCKQQVGPNSQQVAIKQNQSHRVHQPNPQTSIIVSNSYPCSYVQSYPLYFSSNIEYTLPTFHWYPLISLFNIHQHTSSNNSSFPSAPNKPSEKVIRPKKKHQMQFQKVFGALGINIHFKFSFTSINIRVYPYVLSLKSINLITISIHLINLIPNYLSSVINYTQISIDVSFMDSISSKAININHQNIPIHIHYDLLFYNIH